MRTTVVYRLHAAQYEPYSLRASKSRENDDYLKNNAILAFVFDTNN